MANDKAAAGTGAPLPDPTGPGRPTGAAFLLSQLGAHAAARFAERVAPLGLSPAHAGVLRLLGRESDLNQRALAARLQSVPSRVVALLDELEERGLVARRRHPRDRRSHVLGLTSQGQAMLRRLGRVAEAHEADLLAELQEPEHAVLTALLQRLAAAHSLEAGVHPGYRGEQRGAGPP